MKKKNLMIFSLCNNLQAGIRRKRPWKGERSQRKAAKQQVDRSQWKGKAARTKAESDRKRERKREEWSRRRGGMETGNGSRLETAARKLQRQQDVK